MSEVTELHDPFRSYLKSQGIPYRYSRPDKATSENAADADFWVVENGRVLMLEFKQPKTGKLSTRQTFRHAELAKAGCRVFVVRELSVAIELVNAWREQVIVKGKCLGTGDDALITVFGQQWRQKPGTSNELERVK